MTHWMAPASGTISTSWTSPEDNCGLVTYNLGTGKGEKAERELGWRAEYGINEMIRDSWNWQKRNPGGFE